MKFGGPKPNQIGEDQVIQTKVAGRVRTPILAARTLIFACLQNVISNLGASAELWYPPVFREVAYRG